MEIHALYRQLLGHWPAANTRLNLSTREGKTFVIACGPKDAPPLVLLHGAGSVSAMWMSDAAAWSRDFRVYAVDMIGEPGLSAPSRPPLSSEAYALWLDDVMDGLGLARADLVGVSLGGWLAIDYAVRRPGRVERLALLCPAGIGRQKHFVARVGLFLLLGPWGVRKAREMVFGPPPRDLPPAARALAELMALISRSFRPRMGKIPIFSDAALRGLAMPVLAVVGGRDLTIDQFDTRRRLAHTAPNAVVRFLPEAGHHIPGQTAAILEFLRRPAGG